ncbi:DUF6932 family protein [Chelatococcus daeguensis]|uniref:DUF6932 family protein n=1 Tax=Chelatococcus daeguensis TaxID=444444 RepID=UPI001FD87CFE|nr:hypothetical protein [Chelatococcus daeguensis]
MRGLLPPFVGIDATTSDRSPYWASLPELADAFGTTPHRRRLLRNLISYRSLLAEGGYVGGVQFIDGSFVENIEVVAGRNPTDIDVFSILNVPSKYRDNPSLWPSTGLSFWQGEVIDRDRNKQRFDLDTYAVIFEDLHARPALLIRDIIYWYSLFSHQRGTFAWKGFVGLVLDPASDQAALSALGSA